ncbi:MAG: UDP-N-acetylglucosamine 1-carboxyvinyltransferase [Alphaproteobacteria bacterium]|nr:UDP-N-acetylglucosamine 1-carboxyvinyltransferase [Alphaproteobacteria bacterium]
MDRIRIQGGLPLKGRIPISGAKNAVLPLMAASLLTQETLLLDNVPDLADIATLSTLLAQHGVEIQSTPGNGLSGGRLALTAREIANTTAPYDLVRKMRASVLVLGPLVARFGKARVSLPGGCAIGTRPVDLHLKGLEALGAHIELDAGYIEASAPRGLKGAEIIFPQVSVGATENILMAATLAKGESLLVNAAREPEVADLARCLVGMGAGIEGIGTGTLRVQGVDELYGTSHRVVPDRIEIGTYAMAVAITGGEAELVGARFDLIGAVATLLGEAGVAVWATEDGLGVARGNGRLIGVDVMTEPFPGFPTDLQAQIMTLMSVAEGASMITETIFENRFMHVPELGRMGANINVHGASAMVRGVGALKGAQVMATDLRASVSLVLAGLAAAGETIVNRVYHLDRGYERLEAKLAACGARIERVRNP